MVAQEKHEKIKANFKKVIAAARKEGKVVIRWDRHPEWWEPFTKHWHELYGDIELEQIGDGHSILHMASMDAEQKSNNYVTDVYSKEIGSAWGLKQLGYTQRFDYQNLLPALHDPDAVWQTPVHVDPEGYYFSGFQGYLDGIPINTKLVPPEREPKTWDDLLDPYWKGKMLQDYPAGFRTGGIFSLAMKANKRDKFLAKLAEQKSTIVLPQGPEYRTPRIVRGEYPLEVPGNYSAYLLQPPGTPVKWIWPVDGGICEDYVLAILKGAPHPNAALVFANFVLTRQAQADQALGGRWVARGDVPLPFPEFQNLKGKKMLRFDEKWFNANHKAVFAEMEKVYANHVKVGKT